MIFLIFLLVTCVKILLIPSYHSTDFEVHRNWLAITHNLPLEKWYYEDTSKWTLDYPPLFAWFEYFLSFLAVYCEPKMLKLENQNYASFKAVLFQRLSVIVSDSLLAYGTYRCSLVFNRTWRNTVVLPVLVLTNVGLLMVDHIHFQYNGFMFGILLLSVASLYKNQYLEGAFWFTVLLNVKHIYLYMAPAYFVYLLRNYCFTGRVSPDSLKQLWKHFSISNTFCLGMTVISIFLVTYLPFMYQLPQVLSRLFPFKRGLCHAYWAPNVWALYNVIDKAIFLAAKKVGFNVTSDVATMTGGLVQEFSHSILPNITPLFTVVLSSIFMMPALYKLWILHSSPSHFLRCLVLCTLTSFLFGWHVHEKAILMSIIPLSILSVLEAGDAKTFLLLSTVGHYSLFPLLFPNSLLSIKLCCALWHSAYAFYSLSNLYPLHIHKYSLPLLSFLESIYLLGLPVLFLYENLIHHLLGLSSTLPFLPLMLISIYCSIGVIYAWAKYYILFWKTSPKNVVKKNRKSQ